MPFYGGTAQRTDPKFLIERLMQNGYSRVQASAIVGNLQQESSLISNNMNKAGGGRGAFGLMQWRGSRFDDLQNFAASKGTAWTDPGTQADFIAHEMQTTEKGNTKAFLSAKTVDEAAAALKSVIRYDDASLPQRQMFARDALGAAEPAAPGATAALPGVSSAPQPTAAQPAVSRETAPQGGSALRSGVASLGEGLGAQAGSRLGLIPNASNAPQEGAVLQQQAPIAEQQPAGGRGGSNLRSGIASLGGGIGAQLSGTAQTPSGLTSIGNALSGAGDTMSGLLGPQQGSDALAGREAIAESMAGAQFPGGITPMPRARPLTEPAMMRNDRLVNPNQTVAGMSSLVDPRLGYDYYG